MIFFLMVSYAKGQSMSPELLRCNAAFGREQRSYASSVFCLYIMKGCMDLDDTTFVIDTDDVKGVGEGEWERGGESNLAAEVLLFHIDYSPCSMGYFKIGAQP